MKLRRAQAKDAPALTTLVYMSKQSNGYDDAFMAACADELRVTPAQIAETDFFLVQAANDALLGCACLTQAGEIKKVFVHPDHKRRGVGRLLWTALQNAAQARGMTELTLDADPEAVPFYTALGFSIVGESPSGSIPGRVLPQMALRL